MVLEPLGKVEEEGVHAWLQLVWASSPARFSPKGERGRREEEQGAIPVLAGFPLEFVPVGNQASGNELSITEANAWVATDGSRQIRKANWIQPTLRHVGGLEERLVSWCETTSDNFFKDGLEFAKKRSHGDRRNARLSNMCDVNVAAMAFKKT
jgi:hypothetical protein